jgi:hypothetical protein
LPRTNHVKQGKLAKDRIKCSSYVTPFSSLQCTENARCGDRRPRMQKPIQWVVGSLAAGVTMFLVGVTFHLVVSIFAPDIDRQFRGNPLLYRPWDGWTRPYMIAHPFGYGFVFAAVFVGLRQWSNFPSGIRGGFVYGLGIFVVGSLPVFLLAYQPVVKASFPSRRDTATKIWKSARSGLPRATKAHRATFGAVESFVRPAQATKTTKPRRPPALAGLAASLSRPTCASSDSD